MSGPTVIVLTGALVAASCSLVGCFLVLRRMALMGDAISHAVLLGIVLAFFIHDDLGSPLLAVGAALVGLLTGVSEGDLQSQAADQDVDQAPRGQAPAGQPLHPRALRGPLGGALGVLAHPAARRE